MERDRLETCSKECEMGFNLGKNGKCIIMGGRMERGVGVGTWGGLFH